MPPMVSPLMCARKPHQGRPLRIAAGVWLVSPVTCSESSPRPVSQLGDDLDRTRRLLDPGLVRIVEEYQGDSLRAYVQAEFARNAF